MTGSHRAFTVIAVAQLCLKRVVADSIFSTLLMHREMSLIVQTALESSHHLAFSLCL
jgi:hypothetical protein